jgi:hypothetical protein
MPVNVGRDRAVPVEREAWKVREAAPSRALCVIVGSGGLWFGVRLTKQHGDAA